MTSIPEISFAGTAPDQLVAEILARIETNLGRTLAPADPVGLLGRSFAAEDIVLRNLLDLAASQTLLAYASGSNLDALGDLLGVTRLSAVPARCVVRFSAAAPAGANIAIPVGSRVRPSGDINWATEVAATLLAGNTYVDVACVCETAGLAGNGYTPGQISTIVDVIAGITSVANTTESAGGVDTETDEALRARIRLAPTAFSVAGPRAAYEYHARSASAAVADVYVESSEPGEVEIYVLEQQGQLPQAETLAAVLAACGADDRRPLTDHVSALEPGTEEYSVDLEYFVRRSDAANLTTIQAAVAQAVTDWVLWTRSAIGRDINPSELIHRVVEAGAKRVEVAAPAAHVAIDAASIGVIGGAAAITYGGLEDE